MFQTKWDSKRQKMNIKNTENLDVSNYHWFKCASLDFVDYFVTLTYSTLRCMYYKELF